MLNAEELTHVIESVQGRRYPVVLLQGPARSGKTALLERVRDRLDSFRYHDYLASVLNQPSGPKVGAFGASKFCDWLRAQAKTSGVLVDEADPLFSTWSKQERGVLWTNFLRLEVRHPIVLATRFMECAVPELNTGTGRVLRLHREE